MLRKAILMARCRNRLNGNLYNGAPSDDTGENASRGAAAFSSIFIS